MARSLFSSIIITTFLQILVPYCPIANVSSCSFPACTCISYQLFTWYLWFDGIHSLVSLIKFVSCIITFFFCCDMCIRTILLHQQRFGNLHDIMSLTTTIPWNILLIPLCMENLSLIHNSHSHLRKTYSRLLVQCQFGPIWSPVLPLNRINNLLILLLLFWTNLTYSDSRHSKFQTSYTFSFIKATQRVRPSSKLCITFRTKLLYGESLPLRPSQSRSKTSS